MHRIFPLVLVLTWFLTSPAFAQSKAAEERFNNAVKLVQEGKHQGAIEICLDVLPSLAEVDKPRVYKLLGYSFRKLNMLPEAWYFLTQYLQFSGKEDKTAATWLREVEAHLEKKYIKVTINSKPEMVSLSFPSKGDLKIATTTPATWWFMPGKHEVQADKAKHLSRTVEFDIKEVGDTGSRKIVLPPAFIKQKKFSRIPEWTMFGAGIALGITGAVFQILGNGKNEDLHDKFNDRSVYPDPNEAKSLYDDAYADDVKPKMTTAYILYGVGGVAIIGGVVTWMIRKPPQSDKAAGLRITPWYGRDLTGASLSFAW